MRKTTIKRAVKVNFGTKEPLNWKPTLERQTLLENGFEIDVEESTVNHMHESFCKNEWYQRKVELVKNYLRIYGVLALFLLCMAFTSCSPHLNPNGTVNRYHGLNGKDTVKKQQRHGVPFEKAEKAWKLR
jgi:hypothetical protein